MPRFRYMGKTLAGEQVEGHRTALNRNVLEIQLVSDGVFVEEVRASLTPLQIAMLQWFYGGEVTRITRQIAILLESRLEVTEVLELAQDQIKNRALRVILEDIRGQVEAGRSVSQTFRDYTVIFDRSYTAMLEAGESAAQLDRAFAQVAAYREGRERLLKKVRTALTYPILVLCVAVLVVVALLAYVVPVFASMYANFGAELPALTQLIVSLSEFVRQHLWWLGISGLALIIIGLALRRLSPVQAAIQNLPLYLPGIRSVFLKVLSARFSRALGSLLQAGVDITYAMVVASQVSSSPAVTQRLVEANHRLTAGATLTDVLQDTKLFPKPLLKLCQSGEKSGQLGAMLLRASDYYEQQTEQDLTMLTTLLEPLLLLMLGATIAFLLIAMYLPMFELIGSL